MRTIKYCKGQGLLQTTTQTTVLPTTTQTKVLSITAQIKQWQQPKTLETARWRGAEQTALLIVIHSR